MFVWSILAVCQKKNEEKIGRLVQTEKHKQPSLSYFRHGVQQRDSDTRVMSLITFQQKLKIDQSEQNRN